jgi:uncharacterized protein YjbI with pentapeptide repeats
MYKPTIQEIEDLKAGKIKNAINWDLSYANLSGANLSGADLSCANLSCTNLSCTNLRGADLYGANLFGADLSYANLCDANLFGADLSYANLYGADLYGADLRNTIGNSREIKTINDNDNINHPPHYTFGKYEVLDVINDWKLDYNCGSAVKYIARAGKKDKNKEVEDLQKAIFFLQYEVKKLENK